MQKTLEAVFYQCEHTGAFRLGPSAVLPILRSHYGNDCEPTPHLLKHFISIPGYRFKREGKASFIPLQKAPPKSDGPFPFSDLLASRDIIIPPLLMPKHMDMLCRAIKAEKAGAKILTVDFCLATIYTPYHLGRYFESLFRKIEAFHPFLKHIDECIRAYLFGYISVSVSGMLVAAEGILREIGAKIDSRFAGITSKDNFLHALNAIEEIIISKAFCDYDTPRFMKTKTYLLGFDEQVSILESFKNYFSKRLYEKTTEVDGEIDLNRHSVLHGLAMNFDMPVNFYRLFVLLVFLAFVSVVLGHSRASAFVSETEESKKKSEAYEKIAAMGAYMKKSLSF